MMRYNKKQIEALTNWDGLLCQKPFRNKAEECQYYSRYLNERMWKYLNKEDWKRVKVIINDLKIPQKTKDATKFLLRLHLEKKR